MWRPSLGPEDRPSRAPTRVLRAVPSVENLRASGRALVIAGAILLVATLPFLVLAVDTWGEMRGGSFRRVRMAVQFTLLASLGPVAGVVVLVKGGRMLRQANVRAAAETSSRGDAVANATSATAPSVTRTAAGDRESAPRRSEIS